MSIIGEISALITAFCWSGSSISFAEATKRAGSVLVNVARLIVAAFFLLITILIAQISLQLSSTQYTCLVVSGIIGLTFGDTFLFKAYQQLGARVTSLIMSFAPAVSALLAFIFLGEVLSIQDIIGILITIAGIAIVVLEKNENVSLRRTFFNIGLLMAFLGAVGQGSGLVFAKMAFNEGDINGFAATFIRIAAGLITLFPIALISGRLKNPFKTFLADKQAFKYTVLGALMGPYFGITFSLIAISHTKVGIAATIMAIVPILMLPLVKYFYKETITKRAVVGAFVAVAGVALLFLF
ncbi:MAG: DMT family transporter [Bacteroidota bacterium]|nr:DMT family transporter [Bacteroidota bacterium]